MAVVWAQPITLEGLWREYKYYARLHTLWPSAGGWYGQEEEGALYRIGQSLRAETLSRGAPILRLVAAPDGRSWLAWQEEYRLFRRSRAGELVWVREGHPHPLLGLRWQEAEISPDGKSVIAADGQNLYRFSDSTQTCDTLTHYTGEVQAGTTDWLYEEEFAFTKAFAISPSGRYVAYLVLDNTRTPSYPLLRHGLTYPELTLLRYPRVGEPNPSAEIHIYDLQQRQDYSVYQETSGGYLPWFAWSPDRDTLYFIHLHREQNRFTLYTLALPHRQVRPVFRDSTQGYFTWDDRKLMVVHAAPTEILYVRLSATGRELYRLNAQGKLLGTYPIPGLRTLIGRVQDRVFFHAAGSAPIYQRIGYLPLREKKPRIRWLTPDSAWAEAELSGNLLKITTSRFTEPFREEILHALNEKHKLTLPDLNQPLRSSKFGVKMQFLTYPSTNGKERWAYLLLPEDFQEGRTYPVFLTFYGGPGSQQVSTEFKNIYFYWQVYLAQKGYIVACTDGRGTEPYPEERFTIYQRLGLPETEDLVAFIKWLREQPYIGKIAAMGWSYGGYLALRLAFAAPDGLAACIAVAPVTDWRLYDSAYTERFMSLKENPQAQYEATALPPSYTKLKVPVLLIHGDADDNVHVQHSYRFIEKLLRRQPDAPLEWRIFPNQEHGLLGMRYRVYWEVERFLERYMR